MKVMTAVIKIGFWFLVCDATTQLATQLPPRLIQVVHSNRVSRKRPAESNGTPAMDPGHMNIDLTYIFAYYCEEFIRIGRHTNKRGMIAVMSLSSFDVFKHICHC